MKKIYMTPTTKWVEAQAEEMMAGSDLFTPGSGDELIQDLSDPNNTTEATSGNLSRQSLWDDSDF